MTPEASADAMPPFLRLGALGRLRRLFQAKRWSELAEAMGAGPIWAFDRPLPPAECVRLLAEVFGPAEDLSLLVTGNRPRASGGGEIRSTFQCCVLWGEAGSWEERELEFDLHLGSRADGAGAWCVSYLGFSVR